MRRADNNGRPGTGNCPRAALAPPHRTNAALDHYTEPTTRAGPTGPTGPSNRPRGAPAHPRRAKAALDHLAKPPARVTPEWATVREQLSSHLIARALLSTRSPSRRDAGRAGRTRTRGWANGPPVQPTARTHLSTTTPSRPRGPDRSPTAARTERSSTPATRTELSTTSRGNDAGARAHGPLAERSARPPRPRERSSRPPRRAGDVGEVGPDSNGRLAERSARPTLSRERSSRPPRRAGHAGQAGTAAARGERPSKPPHERCSRPTRRASGTGSCANGALVHPGRANGALVQPGRANGGLGGLAEPVARVRPGTGRRRWGWSCSRAAAGRPGRSGAGPRRAGRPPSGR